MTKENIHREKEQAYMQGYEDACKKYRKEPCEDAISRQDVLDYIDKMPSELTADGRRMIRRRTLEEYISDTLPSVNPQKLKTDVLDKIRDEIDGIEINGYIRDAECFNEGIRHALAVIDKYKAESE